MCILIKIKLNTIDSNTIYFKLFHYNSAILYKNKSCWVVGFAMDIGKAMI